MDCTHSNLTFLRILGGNPPSEVRGWRFWLDFCHNCKRKVLQRAEQYPERVQDLIPISKEIGKVTL